MRQNRPRGGSSQSSSGDESSPESDTQLSTKDGQIALGGNQGSPTPTPKRVSFSEELEVSEEEQVSAGSPSSPATAGRRSSSTLRASCFCGAVTLSISLQYESVSASVHSQQPALSLLSSRGSAPAPLTSSPLGLQVCHCVQCRQLTGGSFATNVVLPKEAIELLVNVEAPCPFSPTVHCPPATALDTAPGARTCARPLCALQDATQVLVDQRTSPGVVRRRCARCFSPLLATLGSGRVAIPASLFPREHHPPSWAMHHHNW